MKKVLKFIAYSNAAGAVASAALACMYIIACNGYLSGADNGGQAACTAEWMGYVSLMGCILIGFLSVRPAVEHTLTSIRTQLPATLFFMGCAITPLQVCTPRTVAVLALLALGCNTLLNTYRDYRSMGSYFAAFVFIGLATFIVPHLVFAVPLLLISCKALHSLNLRTILAGVMGLLCVYWLAFGLLYVTDNMAVAANFLSQLSYYKQVDYLPSYNMADMVEDFAPVLWLLIQVLPGSIAVLKNNTMNLRSRACYYYCISVLGLLLLLGFAFPMLYATLLPLWLLLAAYIGIPLYTEANTRAKRTYVMIVLLVWMILVANPLWIRYIPS